MKNVPLLILLFTRKVSEERLEGIVAAKLEAAPASTTQDVPEQRFRFCLAHADHERGRLFSGAGGVS